MTLIKALAVRLAARRGGISSGCGNGLHAPVCPGCGCSCHA